MSSLSRVSVLLALFFAITTSYSIRAQEELPIIRCGSILESELHSRDEWQAYVLETPAGTTLTVSLEPIGTTFNPVLRLSDELDFNNTLPNGYVNEAGDGGLEQLVDYQVSVSNPVIMIQGRNRSVGAFELSVGCILRDGTIINPGAVAAPMNTSTGIASDAPFSGNGFPGLPAVDFGNVARIPLISGMAMTGAITPTGSEILGYVLDANAADMLLLDFNRLSGNLNIGMVVLSADNRVVFQASLVTSSVLSSTFVLPSTGTYTVGVFRIDLLPLAQPEPTAFQITATLNP